MTVTTRNDVGQSARLTPATAGQNSSAALAGSEWSGGLCELIALRAAMAPDAAAIVSDAGTLSYSSLEARAREIGSVLRLAGATSGTLAGVFMERTPDMVAGVLGVLKTGAAYVPADPAYPAERIRAIFEDASVEVLLTERHLLDRVPVRGVKVVCIEDVTGGGSADAGLSTASPDDLAYVIYTSGSTGKPKGVMISHGNLHNYVHAMASALEITETDRVVQTASIAFSSSVRQLMVPLAAGASVLLASRAQVRDARALLEFAGRHRATALDLVPSHWINCLQLLEGMPAEERDALLPATVRIALSASEPLPRDVPERWTRGLGHPARFINMYGQTETTGIVLVNRDATDAPADIPYVPVGRPIANLRAYILDSAGQPLPPGYAGELCISGAGVGLGYHRRPDLTAQRFVANPWAGDPDDRLYRTGDRARLLDDGTIEFLGRLDNQVKIRGYRVEVEEVEAVLRRHSAIQEVAVAGRERAGETRLFAYIVMPRKPIPALEELRAFVSDRLPEYMVPSGFVVLDELPRTPNGKLDRSALPAPDVERPALASGYVAPRNALESTIAGIWQELLGLDRVGVEDEFVALGGHSLLATRVAARLRQALGVELPLRLLFEEPTVARLAAAIERERRAVAVSGAPAILPMSREAITEPSFAQQRLWLLHQLEPESSAYNLCAAIQLRGRLDGRALERALTEIVRRHESLRTVFPTVDGEPRQVVQPAAPLRLALVDVRGAAEPRSEAERLAAEDARRPFDLSTGPLFRGMLIRAAHDEHILVLAMHHIVSDGWSRGVLYREVGTLYDAFVRGDPSPLPELPIQYADYANWQRLALRSDVVDSQLAYWKSKLAGPLPTLDLPTDRPRPSIQSYRGTTRSFRLSRPLAEALRTVGVRHDATLFMTLLAAFQALLGRYAGQEDVIVGSPVAGRTRVETEELIGFFVNTLAMRADLSGDLTFAELLRRVRETSLEAFANQDVPFDRVVESLHLERDMSRSPVFQTLFILQNTPSQPMRLADLALEQIEIDLGGAKYDLTLSIVAGREEFTAHLEYNADLFDAATIERLIGHFQTLLSEIAADQDSPLSKLGILPSTERHRMLVEWNSTEQPIRADSCMHELIAEQALRTPDARAVCFEDASLTYRELDERANRLAHHLRALGVGPDVMVGICMDRSLDMVVGLLGILKAGGAYVPLDPTYPAERIAYMLQDSAAPVLLTQSHLVRSLPVMDARVVAVDADWSTIALNPATEPGTAVGPANLAYVIYTSGSTGNPKGVMIEHRNVVNFFAGMDERVGVDDSGVWLAVTSISFDISVLEIFWTLARGYTVVIQGSEGRAPAPARANGLERALDFSLFYFASNEQEKAGDKYRLLLDGARFADHNGFRAVWTPERHFHAFGGLYPNPSVVSAAIAAITDRVQIRAGSVVLPLHSPIRVAEEWSVVDNLSNGRVGMALASGWHDRDFVFAPDNYARRRELMYEQLEQLRALWRGEAISATTGSGKQAEIRILPRPVQSSLPIWITAAGTPETFETAGRIGANLLTHLLGQSVEQLEQRIALYREARRKHGHAGEGEVTVMLHTFIGTDLDEVRETVRGPFREYLRTSVDLIKGLAEGRGQDLRSSTFTAEDMEALLDHAFDRYFGTSALLGTPESCQAMVARLSRIGVDEVACLIDFGVESSEVFASLEHLAKLRTLCLASLTDSEPAVEADYSVPAQIARWGVTHMQCTPSLAGMLVQQEEGVAALGSLRKLLVGGEAFPPPLAAELRRIVRGEIVNMYGPTETTIWSSTHLLDGAGGSVPIGRPIANTTFYVLDRGMNPVPIGVAGELYIGGAGVVRGYLHRPELTAERFVPSPFRAGERLYRTGDLVRYSATGEVEYIGRLDHQVKLRGHRIELGEVEAALARLEAVRECVAIVREDQPGDRRLVAYVVCRADEPAPADMREPLRARLPEYLVPSHVVILEAMPLTPNGKVDRKALPAPERLVPASAAPSAPPANAMEQILADVWRELLRRPDVGVQDNFFDLGGHSLLTVRVHARLRDLLGRSIPITDLFRFPTIRTLARHLGDAPVVAKSSPQASDRADFRRQALARRRERVAHGRTSTQDQDAAQ